ncbi:MAG: ABC-type sugar transport system substrate-binding protein [Planctomycetota bacterium]|jgi:ABC-type sugar transport system substrate-binding protein
MLTRTLAPILCLLIPACGSEPLAKDPTGKFAVAAKCFPTTLTKTVADTAEATLVVAFEWQNEDVMAAINAAKRTTRPFVVVIGDAPGDTEELADAVIVANSGAAAAVDFALLACNGVALPTKLIEVGLRTITPANRAAGGTLRPGPGDFFLATMRMEHGKLLTTKPETDESHPVGLLQTDPSNSSQERVARDAKAAAARYPQLQLVVTTAPAKTDVAEQAQSMIANGCRVLLLATSDPKQTQAVLAIAAKAPGDAVAVIVLDPLLQEHGACVIGSSPQSLGQTAAKMVQTLLPEGGSIITCFTASEQQPISTVSDNRAFGFCQAMNLPTEPLLGR